jgi:hypothetical protein
MKELPIFIEMALLLVGMFLPFYLLAFIFG